jgi:hypothetical protein
VEFNSNTHLWRYSLERICGWQIPQVTLVCTFLLFVMITTTTTTTTPTGSTTVGATVPMNAYFGKGLMGVSSPVFPMLACAVLVVSPNTNF